MRFLWLPLIPLILFAKSNFASTAATPLNKLAVPKVNRYSLNAVSPSATGPWTFYTAGAGDTETKNYLSISPTIDATNTVRVVAEPNDPWRPVMEWEYGYAAGPITVRPESDVHTSIKKGDLLTFWTAPRSGRYIVSVELENVGNDARGGDGGALTLSHLKPGSLNDTKVIERVAIPPSSSSTPQVQRTLSVDVQAGDQIVMRLNAGIDGYADLWRMQYVISLSNLEK